MLSRKEKTMIAGIVKGVTQALRRFRIRVAGIALLSFVAVLAAKLIGPVLPQSLGDLVGAGAVDRLLDIMASSMLAVTTFSLSVVVTVQRAISSQWTPRANRIQLEDGSSQLVLATFIGAFVYALTSIVLRSAAVFDDRDILVLFVMTLVVLALVVLVMLRWIVRLQTMGTLSDIADRIQRRTETALGAALARPCLGAQPLTQDTVIPVDAREVRAKRSGYVAQVFASVIEAEARDCGGTVYLLLGPGSYVRRGAVLAHVTDPLLEECVRRQVVVGPMRDVEQDPGIGLRMLAEIASRALSPGVHDSGTAIDMIDRITWTLETWRGREGPPPTPKFDRVFLPPADVARLVSSPFGLIARDGAGVLDVQFALQARLGDLSSHHPDPVIAEAAEKMRRSALARGIETLTFDEDRAALKAAADQG